jgi:hypothetical protein
MDQPVALPPGWVAVDGTRAAAAHRELIRELPLGHALSNIPVAVLAMSESDPDDLLLHVEGFRSGYAVVHLTWRTEVDPAWPHTAFYRTLGEIEEEESVESAAVESALAERAALDPPAFGQPIGYTAARRPDPPRFTPFQFSIISGLLFAFLQFAAFPCNALPVLSMGAGFVTGATAVGAWKSVSGSHWGEGCLLAIVAFVAGAVLVVSHMCA